VQLGETDIDAIEISYEIAQDQEWNKPPHHLADDAFLNVFHGATPVISLKAGWSISGPFRKTMTIAEYGRKWYLRWCGAVVRFQSRN
jgi:hypothetical protein